MGDQIIYILAFLTRTYTLTQSPRYTHPAEQIYFLILQHVFVFIGFVIHECRKSALRMSRRWNSLVCLIQLCFVTHFQLLKVQEVREANKNK